MFLLYSSFHEPFYNASTLIILAVFKTYIEAEYTVEGEGLSPLDYFKSFHYSKNGSTALVQAAIVSTCLLLDSSLQQY
jgi:hypothetical protein